MARTLTLSPNLAPLAHLAIRHGLPGYLEAHDEELAHITLADLNRWAAQRLPTQALEVEGRRMLATALELLRAAEAARQGDYYR